MSDSSAPSDGRKALDYAEKELGVHVVYQTAVEARQKLDAILTDLSNARDRKRDTEARLMDAELEVANNEWAKHPDMAVTRMEKHLKTALAQDDTVRELREQVARAASDIDGLEMDKLMSETDIRIAVARLQELGGYFHYLAVIKQQAAKPVKQTESKGPWD